MSDQEKELLSRIEEKTKLIRAQLSLWGEDTIVAANGEEDSDYESSEIAHVSIYEQLRRKSRDLSLQISILKKILTTL